MTPDETLECIAHEERSQLERFMIQGFRKFAKHPDALARLVHEGSTLLTACNTGGEIQDLKEATRQIIGVKS